MIDLIFPFLASGMLDDEKVIRKTPIVMRHASRLAGNLQGK